MKTFEEHIFEIAAEKGYSEDYIESKASRSLMVLLGEEACKRYAREAIAEHLERAAREATIRLDKDEYCEIDWVDRDSVRNIEIILK